MDPKLPPRCHFRDSGALPFPSEDLRGLPLARRKRTLDKLVWAATTVVPKVFSVEECGLAFFRAAERLDVEGVAAKRMADLYTPETVWLKVKNRVYTQTEGRWELFHGPLV